jgi:integrase
VRQGLVTRNVASLVDGRPRAKGTREDAKAHCWTLDEARTFLAAAKNAGPQLAAFFALALDSGMRKNELCGLAWSAVDLDNGRVTVDRQLVTPGRTPAFGPTKTGAPRVIDLNAETIRLLREHKRAQAALKMRNRATYHDLGLVFAKEWGDVYGREDSLGNPLQSNNLGQREFARVLKASGVRRIKFHGLRHTCATLLLGAGEPVHVVSQRLGHANPTITLSIYAHAIPLQQQRAAATLGALLHG